MLSYSKKTSITLPEPLEVELRQLAEREHRTLSGIIQEAARTYVRLRSWEDLQQEARRGATALGLHTEDDVIDLIHQAREAPVRHDLSV